MTCAIGGCDRPAVVTVTWRDPKHSATMRISVCQRDIDQAERVIPSPHTYEWLPR